MLDISVLLVVQRTLDALNGYGRMCTDQLLLHLETFSGLLKLMGT